MPLWTGRRRIVVALLLLVVLAWAVVVAAVAVTGASDQARAADAIAVLGAAQYSGRPSPVFRARLDHAAGLLQRGLAPLVLVTGGVGAGDTLSEAEVGRRYLVGRGVAVDAVIALPPAATTVASLQRVAEWFDGRTARRGVLGSAGVHLLRLNILAHHRGLIAYTSPPPRSPLRANPRRHAMFVLSEGFKVPVTWV